MTGFLIARGKFGNRNRHTQRVHSVKKHTENAMWRQRIGVKNLHAKPPKMRANHLKPRQRRQEIDSPHSLQGKQPCLLL